MLVVDRVRYEYQQQVFEFSLNVREGAILSLMGASGAGKSTLLSLIAGFIEPVSGSILVNGREQSGKVPYERPFSMLFQEHNLFAHLTVRENIGLGLHPGLKLTQAQHQQVTEAARMVGVDALLDRLPEQLSGGQKQRVALARCFVQPHRIWLLDEPFSALDPVLRSEMLQLVSQLVRERNITVIMVTHHISDARAIATDFAFISEGRVRICEPIEKLSRMHSDPLLSEFVTAGE